MMSDSYPIKEVDDVIFEVDCDAIYPESVAGDDEPDEFNNVIYSFRLQPTTYDKKTYVSSLRCTVSVTPSNVESGLMWV
ncbi:hypothetical protein SNK03_004065 [Fusarium graminearum]